MSDAAVTGSRQWFVDAIKAKRLKEMAQALTDEGYIVLPPSVRKVHFIGPLRIDSDPVGFSFRRRSKS